MNRIRLTALTDSALWLMLALIVCLLAGCGVLGDKADQQKNWTVEQFYRNARDDLDSGNYINAIKLYEALEAKYPFGRYAQQAQLDISYAYYKQGETAQATTALDRFIKLHPNHPNLDYALYLKGLAYFKPDLGFLGSILSLDQAERDPKVLRESFEVFKDLVVRFPDSRYSPDARSKMTYLVNALAKHNMAVARYYFSRGGYLAAANRAQQVLLNFPQSDSREAALAISVKSYERMGMADLANDSRRILEKNFPNSKALESDPDDSGSWWKIW